MNNKDSNDDVAVRNEKGAGANNVGMCTDNPSKRRSDTSTISITIRAVPDVPPLHAF